MSFCPECGEENPEGSKFCRRCGINLIHETPKTEPKQQTTAKKVTVETNQGPVNTTRVNTNSSSTTINQKDDGTNWGWCCVCLIFLFIIFAIFSL